MPSIYEQWKPLRNHLTKTDLHDTLGVIRAYYVRRALGSRVSMPPDIQVHAWVDRPTAFLPWQIELLAREAIIVCDPTSIPQNTLRNASYMALAMNKVRSIEDFIDEQTITAKNIRQAVSVRLAHQQFKFNTDRPSHEWMIRYSKIFGNPQVAAILKAKTGLEPKVLFTIGAALFGHYISTFGLYYPLEEFSLTGITEDDFKIFVELFGVPIADMKAKLAAERQLDYQFCYAFNSLYSHPLVLTELAGRSAYICPLPTLLYWRMTSGLYYDLCKQKGFDNAFGSAFESYVGQIYTSTFASTKIRVYPGEPNTASSPNRCDWVIDQPHEALINECKTKRLTRSAKVSIDDDNELFKQLNILGDAIKQAYLSLQAYRDEAYSKPLYRLAKEKKAFVAVTTLEKWFLMGEQIELLHEIVREKVTEAGLSESLIDESPYVVASVDDMEEFAWLAKTHTFSELIQPYADTRLASGWEYATFLRNNFGAELGNYEYIFDGELSNAFTVDIDETKRSASRKQKMTFNPN